MTPHQNLIPLSSRSDLTTSDPMQPEAFWLQNFISGNTRAAYQQAVAEFIRFAGIADLDNLRRVDRGQVLAWRRHLEAQGYAPRTIRARLAALSSLFFELCESQLVGVNPCHGLKRPSVDDRQVESVLLTKAQVRGLLAAPDKATLAGKRDLAILGVLLYTGARISEVANLKCRDLFEDAGFWVLRSVVKGGKRIKNPLNSQLLFWLRDYLEASGHGQEPDGPLFLPVKPLGVRRHLRRLQIDRIFQKWACKASLPAKATAHSCRASFASHALAGGVAIELVQEALGHASIATTRKYCKKPTAYQEAATLRIQY